MKPAVVRFYFDEDILGLGRLLAGISPEVTYPGDPGGTVNKRERPPCPVSSGTQDSVWIPAVTERGWLIVTRDAGIKEHRREVDAVRENGARMVVLVGKEAVTTWAQLEVVMCQWRRIEDLAGLPGPFVYSITRTGTPRKVL